MPRYFTFILGPQNPLCILQLRHTQYELTTFKCSKAPLAGDHHNGQHSSKGLYMLIDILLQTATKCLLHKATIISVTYNVNSQNKKVEITKDHICSEKYISKPMQEKIDTPSLLPACLLALHPHTGHSFHEHCFWYCSKKCRCEWDNFGQCPGEADPVKGKRYLN